MPEHYETVAAAIRFIRTHARQQPSLGDIAAAVGLSEFQLQKTFSAWAGISPKRFLQYLTKEHARAALQNASDVLSASLEAGLSSPGRLHDLMVSCEALTPGEIRSGGAGLHIRFGAAGTPFGPALIAWTERGICHLAFAPYSTAELATLWPAASLHGDQAGAHALLQQVFPARPCAGKLHLLLRGTNFQIKAWEALLRIPSGQRCSYAQLSRLAGAPRAARAIGSALAANHIAYLIPCHRVIRESGDSGEYRWGSERKLALLAWESAHSPP